MSALLIPCNFVGALAKSALLRPGDVAATWMDVQIGHQTRKGKGLPLIAETDLHEIVPPQPAGAASPEHIQNGVPIPAASRVRTFSPDDWEIFVEEWAGSLKGDYSTVRRFGGSGDLGVDIAGFCSGNGFLGEWDNFQCKRYNHPLRPSDVWAEIGKIIYYSFLGEYIPPRKHFFVCPHGMGTSLEKLLNNPEKLKQETRTNWTSSCEQGITSTAKTPLSGSLLSYFDQFDFNIFTSVSLLELIEGHRKTGFHAVRFGGGLPERPAPELPPEKPAKMESRYIKQLLNAYGDHLGAAINDAGELKGNVRLEADYLRQRVRFYSAEALRNFARDRVPGGTFDSLKDEVFHGVVDICDGGFVDGFERMRATTHQATILPLPSSALASVMKTQDRQGICHQLANDDRLRWVNDD